MAIYAISDLHLSFNTDKPMDIFGWDNYEQIIEKNWKSIVKDDDLILLPGDFSWEMELNNTYKDFEFINKLPGKKILLKGNHDYWWNTVLKMRNYIKKMNFSNIDFLYNNSYEYENNIIAGTRGWSLLEDTDEDKKIIKREELRLEMSIKDGIKKYGSDKDIIVCMHYPPLIIQNRNTCFTEILEKYNVKKCIYGHLHGNVQDFAVNEKQNGVEYMLVSCDYTKFNLIKIY